MCIYFLIIHCIRIATGVIVSLVVTMVSFMLLRTVSIITRFLLLHKFRLLKRAHLLVVDTIINIQVMHLNSFVELQLADFILQFLDRDFNLTLREL
jgi:hypothetical protein